MPVIDSTQPRFPVVPIIIVSNLFPLLGVVYYDMSFFMLFYLYWWETVIISVFQFIKMGKAKKQDVPNPNFTINNKTLTYEQVNSPGYMRRMYAIVRVLMLLFYLIFILVFVGILQETVSGDTDRIISFAQTVLLQDTWMQVSFLLFFVIHAMEYWNWILTKQNEQTSLRELGTPFDGRVIVLHVVIVGGSFLSIYASENWFPDYPKAGQVAFAALFVFVKTIVDVITYKMQTRKTQTILTTYSSLQIKKSKQ